MASMPPNKDTHDQKISSGEDNKGHANILEANTAGRTNPNITNTYNSSDDTSWDETEEQAINSNPPNDT